MKWLISMLFAVTMADAVDNITTRLTSIARAFDARESAPDAVEAHVRWLQTQQGRSDVVFLAANYDRLSDQQKYEIPTELARTGLLAVVPLLEQALARKEDALAGVFFANHLGKPESGFNKAVAPMVVPWIGKSVIESRDTALMLLPVLDPELAAKVLFMEKFVGLDAPKVHYVLGSCNDAGLNVPRSIIDPLLTAWEKPAQDTKAEYRIERGYLEALKALAAHDPLAATQRAETIIQARPSWSDNLADLPLLASGLVGLYDKVADLADTPGRFNALPAAAQFYFAVSYFESDCSNGGFSQALGNSTGDFLPLVRSAYKAIDDRRGLEWLEWMCKPFGKDGPSPIRAERLRQMEAMKPSFYEQEDGLSDAWNEKHRDEPYQVSTSWKLAVFASKHADEIKKALARH